MELGVTQADAIAYADDMVLIGLTPQSIKTLLIITAKYEFEFSVSFNPDKSFILRYPYNNNTYSNVNLFYNNVKIKVIKES